MLESEGTVSAGDLLAYLDGDRSPQMVQALHQSPELRTRLQTIQQVVSLFDGASVPDPQDLVNVAAGQATMQQQLRVAAYLRESAAGRAEMNQLLAKSTPRWRGLRQLLALPLAPAMYLRSSPSYMDSQVFQTFELEARLTMRIAPQHEGQWLLEGYITQDEQPVVGARVTLTEMGGRSRVRQTDDLGFFVFARTTIGSYRMRAVLGQAVLLVPKIAIGGEETWYS